MAQPTTAQTQPEISKRMRTSRRKQTQLVVALRNDKATEDVPLSQTRLRAQTEREREQHTQERVNMIPPLLVAQARAKRTRPVCSVVVYLPVFFFFCLIGKAMRFARTLNGLLLYTLALHATVAPDRSIINARCAETLMLPYTVLSSISRWMIIKVD